MSRPRKLTMNPLSERLREAIEEEIATGKLQPGAHLDEAELAQRFGVSRTPIRETLILLAGAGLVEARPRRGAVVAQVSAQRLVEMFDVMGELEAMCARLAARRITDEEMAALEQVHQDCRQAAESGDSDAYFYANERFHLAIYGASHNVFLAEQAGAIQRKLRPYRRLQLRVRNRVQRSFAEHQAILDALRVANGEQSAQAMRSHVVVQGERFADLMADLARLAQPEAASAASGAPA
jgi:DNA-binding GntR family transcriptional regulator